MRYPTLQEIELLHRVLGIKTATPRSMWGYCNCYAPKEDEAEAFREMLKAGFVRTGFEYYPGRHYYHATALGCSTVGMTEVEISCVLDVSKTLG